MLCLLFVHMVGMEGLMEGAGKVAPEAVAKAAAGLRWAGRGRAAALLCVVGKKNKCGVTECCE